MRRSLALTVPPTLEPLLVEDLRRHLRLDTAEEDFLLETWLVAARRHVEAYTGAALMPQTWELRLDDFPPEDEIELPRHPTQASASIQYVDHVGTLQTFAGANYELAGPADPSGAAARVVLGHGKAWPTARGHAGDVRITFSAGYAERKEVPPEILSAILLVAADLYANREAQITEGSFAPNPTVRTLLAAHRRGWFA